LVIPFGDTPVAGSDGRKFLYLMEKFSSGR